MATYLFRSQHLAFQNFVNFDAQFTPVQLALVSGQLLDASFDLATIHGHLDKYFEPSELQFIASTSQTDTAKALTSASNSTFQTKLGSGFNAAIQQGAQQGNDVTALVKAALGIASRASVQQLAKASNGRVPNAMMYTQFTHFPVDKHAGNFVERLGKFLEPDTMHSMLTTMQKTNQEGAMRTPEATSAVLQIQQPLPTLNMLVQEAQDIGTARKLGIADAIKRLKFQRNASHYSATVPRNPINKITEQFRAMNQFKSKIISGRFT